MGELEGAYKMAGPYEVVARDGQYRSSKGGSERDMRKAYDSALAGDTATALTIINAYAQTLQRFDGHDAPLCSIQSYWLVRAMTLMRNTQFSIINSQLPQWEAMVRRAMLPMMEQFEAASPYANGNWGAIVNRLRMACAIFLQDAELYQASIDYFLYANDNGALPRYVSETGQCQETGRDQGHAQLGLGAQCDICAMAWEQPVHGPCPQVDLWGAFDCRLMNGMEYSARYNLGYDVPFERWADCTGLYCDWTEPGAMGRGQVREVYDAAYQHYTEMKHLDMPYTRQLLALQAQAEAEGRVKVSPEVRTFSVPGVKEGSKLHQVFTYPAPIGAPLRHDFDVYVQPRGHQEWTRIDTYSAKVNATSPTTEISYAFFDFTGDVFVRVVPRSNIIRNARVRPDYRGVIANVQNDSTLQFLLFQPENVSVEFEYADSPEGQFDTMHNLLLFTSKPTISKENAKAEARQQGRKFVFVPEGFYTNETLPAPLSRWRNAEGVVVVPSNTTVYLAPGSYLTTTLAVNDAHDVSILGRGIARPERGYEGCHVYRSKNVLIDGLIVNTCPIGEATGVTLHDVRSISHPQWGDGLNVFGGSSNILFDRVFCRNSDDCTTVYATRKGFSGSVRNVRMTNSTLWADVAHPIMIGLHGNPEVGDSIVNLRYDNIDILCHNEPQVEYQGCMAINCGDGNHVKDVTFDNIRVEQIDKGSLLQVRVGWNAKYCTAPGGSIENVLFRNIRRLSPNSSPVGGGGEGASIITGYDSAHKVKNVIFETLKINGRTIYDDMPGKPKWHATSDYVPMFVGSHVENLQFKK